MHRIIYRLLAVINKEEENSLYYSIAITMLENIGNLKKMNINKIAELCYVSTPSISRFCRDAGFEDFFEFREILQSSNSAQMRNVLDNPENCYATQAETLLHDYYKLISNHIEELSKNVDMKAIDQLVKDIMVYKNVAAFGFMHSHFAAMDLQTKLIKAGKVILTFDEEQKQLNYLKNATDNTLVILISLTGNYLLNTLFKNKGIYSNNSKAKVVLLTLNKDFKYRHLINDLVYIGGKNNVFTDNYSLQFIVDMLAFRYQLLCGTNKAET